MPSSNHRIKIGTLRLLRAVGVFALARWMTRHRVRVLCYHGAALGDEGDFNPKLFAPRSLVRDRLRWLLSKGYRPMPLHELVSAIERREPVGADRFVVTADDGWYSSMPHIVRPALDMGVPITLYIASEVAEKRVPVIDVTVEYILSKAKGQGPFAHDGSVPLPEVIDLRTPQSRARSTEATIASCKQHVDDPEQVAGMLQALAVMVGLGSEGLALSSRRFDYLSIDEMQELSRAGCDVQLHGHAHIYPLGDPAALATDVRQCMRFLQSAGLPPATHYCFPSGVFDGEAAPVLKSLGVQSGVTCIPGSVDPGGVGSAYYIPRFVDGGDVSQIEFEAEVCGVAELARRMRRAIRN